MTPDDLYSSEELVELRQYIDEFKIIYRYSNQKNRLLASLGFSKLNMSNFDSNKVHKLRRSLLDQPIELKWDPEKGQFETE